MKSLIKWLCHKCLKSELNDEYNKLLQKASKYDKQFRPENPLITEERLKDFEADLLKALLNELKSTKN